MCFVVYVFGCGRLSIRLIVCDVGLIVWLFSCVLGFCSLICLFACVFICLFVCDVSLLLCVFPFEGFYLFGCVFVHVVVYMFV